jgi:signal transduction histidine kinase
LGKRIEVSAMRSDGSEFPVELTITAIGERHRPTFTAFIRDLTERKRAEAAFRNYSRLLLEAQETERQNIARELHDQIGQLLTAIRINLQNVRDSSKTAKSETLTDEGMTLVDDALGQVRDLSFQLRPSLLDDLGLIAALRWYADRYRQRTGIKTKRVIELAGQRLPRQLETACFRIVQEAMTNVARHGGAKKVVINLRMLNDEIFLSVKDNGCGFDSRSMNSRSFPIRLGLRGMEERALALGGRLEIESAPGQGTEIRAYFPNEDREGSVQGSNKGVDC